MRRSHRHPDGHRCRCPFGSHAILNPAPPVWNQEVYGKTAVFHESAKLDWLRGRPDMQTDEHQQFLDHLEHNHPEHDSLFPWLARERKKGRVQHIFAGDGPTRSALRYEVHDGGMKTLESEDLDSIQEWMKYHKKTGNKGIDIMQHKIGDAMHEADKHDGGGEIVHTFGSKMGENDYRDWTIRRLRHKKDMRKEGQRMKHCVGSNGMPYIDRQEAGQAEYYSLRDPQNNPHATLELNKDNWHGIPTEHDPHAPYAQDGFRQGEYYGPHDSEVDDDHDHLIQKWANPLGHYPESGHGEDEEENFEPWWDEYYTIPGPESVDEFLSYANDNYEQEYAPEEYDNAVADAMHHNLNPPTLSYDEPDYDSVWESFLDKHRDKPDPEKIKEFREHFNYHTSPHDNFDTRAQQWLEEEYNNYLDPYGQQNGPGFGFSSPQWNQVVPAYKPAPTPEGEVLNTPAPELPGAHYPGRRWAGEEYLARNLQHWLQDASRDPQTGQPMTSDAYPAWRPENEEGAGQPGYGSGPSLFQRRDEAIQNNPTQPQRVDPRAQENLWRQDPEAFGLGNRPPEYAYPRGEWQRPDPVMPEDRMQRADNPEDFYGEPNTKQHQPPIPGMQNTYDPTNQNFYPVNQQQGMIFPGGWYHDNDAYTARKTDLPPHLFMPDHFSWMPHQQHPEQQSMWTNYQSKSPTGDFNEYSIPNTTVPGSLPEGFHTVPPNPVQESWQNQRAELPRMPWVAKAERPWEKPRWSIESVDKTYHPRQDDEWVDGDEPEFSVVQPEPRWGV